MTFYDVKKLRQEIKLNSLFVSDYENSFGYDPHKVCDFFDGYVEYLAELMEEEKGSVPDNVYFDVLWTYDTDENLKDWWTCFEENPFGGAK